MSSVWVFHVTRCKLFLLAPDVFIYPHCPHPLYNELDRVFRLQAHLCPNTLSRLEMLCKAPDTDVLPFSRAWEVAWVCRVRARESERAAGILLACTTLTPPPPFLFVETQGRNTQRFGLLRTRCHGRASSSTSRFRQSRIGSGAAMSREENVLTSTFGKHSYIYVLPT